MGAETTLDTARVVRIGTLNRHGRAGWPQVLALQFAVRLSRLRRDLEQVEELCEPDCWKSLASAAWESEGWREAARQYQSSKPSGRAHSTPQATIEAILCAVRARDLGALEEPKIVGWLSECDAAAKAEMDRRIAAKDTAR